MKYFPSHSDENIDLLACCGGCAKKVALITNIMYPQQQPRSTSPLEEFFCLDLHGMEIAEAAMACVGSFLTTTERALFGVALNPTPTRASEMVCGKNVTELDFVDIEPELAKRLTDGDLSGILINIDAKNHLKVLKLTHCTGMTGSGLEPLRNSRVLELIDLSLVKLHDSPRDAIVNLSEGLVLPILDSIIQEGEQSALRLIQFPSLWKRRSTHWLQGFMLRFNDFLNEESRQQCGLCKKSSPQGFNCYLCLEHTCKNCFRTPSKTDPENAITGSCCSKCEKGFCRRCVGIKKCHGDYCTSDNRDYCSACLTVCKTCKVAQCDDCNSSGGTCSKCGNEWCSNFGTSCMGEYCFGCSKPFCDSCAGDFDFCGGCGEVVCRACRSDNCKHMDEDES
jgi:hypothetical protein